WSWIALADVAGAIEHALLTGGLRGAGNVGGPNPIEQPEVAKVLGRGLGRPPFLPLPGFQARLGRGPLAAALLLARQHVEPNKLREAGYRFAFSDLETALRSML